MLKFDSYVFCIDHLPGQSGKLLGVVLNTNTMQITDLVVGRSKFHPQDRIIPISALQTISDDQIYLSISAASLADYPEYCMTPVHPKAQRAVFPALPLNQIVIGPKTRIFNGEDWLGFVEQIGFDETTNNLTYLKVKRFLSRHSLMVPATAIKRLNHSRIYVSISEEALTMNLNAYFSSRRWPPLLRLPQKLTQLAQKRPTL